jgi:hypothetical protein
MPWLIIFFRASALLIWCLDIGVWTNRLVYEAVQELLYFAVCGGGRLGLQVRAVRVVPIVDQEERYQECEKGQRCYKELLSISRAFNHRNGYILY